VIEEMAAHLKRFGPGYSQVIVCNETRHIIRRGVCGDM
jgi:hypothetical protein